MSKIEWTTETWNPTTGCRKVSRGCDNCYAEKMHKRLTGMRAKGYENPFLDGAVEQPHTLNRPYQWKTPRTIFVNSMSDLFHDNISFAFITSVINVMHRCPQHTFQVLTKRPKRARDFFNQYWYDTKRHVDNLWLGISTENQKLYDKRMKLFDGTAWTPVKFLSCEPLVGPIDLTTSSIDDINWVIVGGESGWGEIERMDMDWVRGISDACLKHGIKYFFKQHGTILAKEKGMTKSGGNLMELSEDERKDPIYRREFPNDTA